MANNSIDDLKTRRDLAQESVKLLDELKDSEAELGSWASILDFAHTTGNATFAGNVGIGTSTPNSELHVVGDIRAVGNIRATGDIIANRYVVSSSVTNLTQSFSSGSTIFGDDSGDTHRVTGSLLVTGSLNVEKGRIFEQGSSVIDHATAMAIVFGG